jgi:transcriptional regulator of nitric oxide reductase
MDTAAIRQARSWAVHLARVALLGAILWLIHLQYARTIAAQHAQSLAEVPLARVQEFFPSAERLGDAESHGGLPVLDAEGRALGFVIQTAPASDPYLGFSGPTNCLVAFDPQEKVLGVAILSSRDTRDHVELVSRDKSFLASWRGLSWQDAAARRDIDGVSGATLTSLAIAQGLQRRLGASPTVQKFPEVLTVADAQALFPSAARIEVDRALPSLWHVSDAQGQRIGAILRTSPAADEIVGYQGPTEARIGIAADGRIVGVTVGRSFDNEPYVTYVRDDEYFRSLFTRYNLAELAKLDPRQAKIEGVSGATMTSLAVARGLIKAATEHEAALRRQSEQPPGGLGGWRTWATAGIILTGIAMGLTPLRGRARFRIVFQVVLIVYLGLLSGELLSLAMFVGWVQSGIAWRNATGLALLAAAALLLPIGRGQNVYCSHLCPHGAVQQLLPRRWKLRRPLPRWLARLLRMIRPLLLAWALLVALCQWPFSLVDLEPFDAWSWRAAAWPTFAVAIVGLVASLFVPMAYCRYGCTTGAVLEYLRHHRQSYRLTRADILAAACLVIGLGIFVFG